MELLGRLVAACIAPSTAPTTTTAGTRKRPEGAT
jgi:hypothetical protein